MTVVPRHHIVPPPIRNTVLRAQSSSVVMSPQKLDHFGSVLKGRRQTHYHGYVQLVNQLFPTFFFQSA
jgi:hypothetical protein